MKFEEIEPIDEMVINPETPLVEVALLMKLFNFHLEARSINGKNGWMLVRNHDG